MRRFLIGSFQSDFFFPEGYTLREDGCALGLDEDRLLMFRDEICASRVRSGYKVE